MGLLIKISCRTWSARGETLLSFNSACFPCWGKKPESLVWAIHVMCRSLATVTITNTHEFAFCWARHIDPYSSVLPKPPSRSQTDLFKHYLELSGTKWEISYSKHMLSFVTEQWFIILHHVTVNGLSELNYSGCLSWTKVHVKQEHSICNVAWIDQVLGKEPLQWKNTFKPYFIFMRKEAYTLFQQTSMLEGYTRTRGTNCLILWQVASWQFLKTEGFCL